MNFVKAARWYAEHGIPVFPCVEKRPLTPNGFHDASTDLKQIDEWFKRWPNANIGIPMGKASGLNAMDVDPRNGGLETWEALKYRHGPGPNTAQSISGREDGGSHTFFKDPDVRVPKTLGPGVDWQGEGSYVIVPPSIHPVTGKPYVWDGLAGKEALLTPAECPAWILELGRARATANGDVSRVIPPKIPRGVQHKTLVSMAGSMRNRGAEFPEIFAALVAMNPRLEEPAPEENLRRIAESVCRYEAGKITLEEPPEASAEEPPETGAPPIVDNADAPPPPPRAARKEPNVDEIARAITADHHFARDPGGRLYAFRNGVYRPVGELLVRQRVKGLMTQWGVPAKWSTHRAAEVVEYIRVDSPELWAAPPVHTLNVTNGLLDVLTRKLRPHDPAFLSAVQITTAYDPAASCPAWDEFIVEVFPPDSEAIAWEIPAWMMSPENPIQKAILLLGEGANGKSTYLRACGAFIGKHNTAALSLHKLEQDKFAAARLLGKLANICPDLPTAHLSSTSMFKALTGGDVLSAEYKFRDSFEFVPFCKLVFSANRPPQSDDATHGFFRRWQVVPFLRSFEDGDTTTKTREQLDAALADRGELSGVLNKALPALAQIRKNGFTQSDSMKAAWEEFRQATDPLAVWLDQQTVLLPNVMVLKADLMSAYNKHLTDSGKAPSTKSAFGLALKRARPGIQEGQRTYRGREKQWVYIGIALKVDDRTGGTDER